MSQSVTDSFRNVTRYLGQDYRFAPTYVRNRAPTPNDVKPKEQQGFYPINSFWSDSTNGDLWVLLSFFNSPVQARWVLLTQATTAAILDIGLPAPSGNAVTIAPDANGLINFTSNNQSITFTGTAGGLGAQNIDFSVKNYIKDVWTPTVDGVTPGVTTYDFQYGTYVRYGGLIQAEFHVSTLTSTGTGHIVIGGLPVPINPTFNGRVAGSVILITNLTWPLNRTSISLLGFPGTSILFIYTSGSGTVGEFMDIANVPIEIVGTIIYET